MPSPPKPRRTAARTKSHNPEATRAAILAAATEELLAHGYDAMAVRDVCARAGRSTGALYHLFGGKEQVLKGVVQPAATALAEALEGEGVVRARASRDGASRAPSSCGPPSRTPASPAPASHAPSSCAPPLRASSSHGPASRGPASPVTDSELNALLDAEVALRMNRISRAVRAHRNATRIVLANRRQGTCAAILDQLAELAGTQLRRVLEALDPALTQTRLLSPQIVRWLTSRWVLRVLTALTDAHDEAEAARRVDGLTLSSQLRLRALVELARTEPKAGT